MVKRCQVKPVVRVMGRTALTLVFIILLGAYLNPPHVQAASVVSHPSPYVDLHSKVIKNGGEIDGVLLAVEVSSNLSKLTLVTPNGSVTLLKVGEVYVPARRVMVDNVVVSELPYNATFLVFYSGFSARYVPPLNFSRGRFVLTSPLSMNVSNDGFYLNITYPRGSLVVTGRNGMDFIFKDSYTTAGNRTFNGSPIKAGLAYCVRCETKTRVKMTGYNIEMKLGSGGYEGHLAGVRWKPIGVVIERGFSFENLTLYDNCTRLIAYTYRVNCTTISSGGYGDVPLVLLGIGVGVLLLLVILRWGEKR